MICMKREQHALLLLSCPPPAYTELIWINIYSRGNRNRFDHMIHGDFSTYIKTLIARINTVFQIIYFLKIYLSRFRINRFANALNPPESGLSFIFRPNVLSFEYFSKIIETPFLSKDFLYLRLIYFERSQDMTMACFGLSAHLRSVSTKSSYE